MKKNKRNKNTKTYNLLSIRMDEDTKEIIKWIKIAIMALVLTTLFSLILYAANIFIRTIKGC